MKRVLSVFLVLLVLTCAVPSVSHAANNYLIPDSDSRYLTYAELWTWTYDALGYILNEMFARYGMPFEKDGKYHQYFSQQNWYQPNPSFQYSDIKNDFIWTNERLVKEVRADMLAIGTRNTSGNGLPEMEPQLTFADFAETYFKAGQSFPVYSGPGTQYYRAANGKATVSSNGSIYVAGQGNGWLLVMYYIDGRTARVGYIDGSKVKDSFYAAPLSFEYEIATLAYACSLTDDPVLGKNSTIKLSAGTQVTYLEHMHSGLGDWAYVEANTALGLMRGFVPYDCMQWNTR